MFEVEPLRVGHIGEFVNHVGAETAASVAHFHCESGGVKGEFDRDRAVGASVRVGVHCVGGSLGYRQDEVVYVGLGKRRTHCGDRPSQATHQRNVVALRRDGDFDVAQGEVGQLVLTGEARTSGRQGG